MHTVLTDRLYISKYKKSKRWYMTSKSRKTLHWFQIVVFFTA